MKTDNNTIVAELSLTEQEVKALVWILSCWLKQYKEYEYSPLKTHAEGIKEALESV